MHRDLLERLTVDEQVVDAERVEAFEEVVGGDGPEIALQGEQRLVDLVDELGLDGVGEDGVAVLGDALQVVLELGEWVGRRGGGGSPRGDGSLGWSHVTNCTDVGTRRRRARDQTGRDLHSGGRNWPVVGSCVRAVGAVGSALA